MDNHQERDLRAEFEAEMSKLDIGEYALERNDCGEYIDLHIEAYWSGFKMARRSSPSTQRQGEEGSIDSQLTGAPSAVKCNAALRAAPAGQRHFSGAALTKRRIEQIGWSLRMHAFENAVYRTEQGSQMTVPEQDEVNQLVDFARAIESEVVARFRAEGGNTSDRMAEVAHPADAPEGGKHP